MKNPSVRPISVVGLEKMAESEHNTVEKAEPHTSTLHRCICGEVCESRLDFYDHICDVHNIFAIVTEAMLDSTAQVPPDPEGGE